MNTALRPVFRNFSAFDPQLPPFSLVLLHDTALAATAAQATIGHVLAGPLKETEIHQDQWTFDELYHSEFRKEALELAAGCDVMFVAMSSLERLPTHVLLWITAWNKGRNQKDAGLVFLTRSRGAPLNESSIPADIGPAANLALYASVLDLPNEKSLSQPEVFCNFNSSYRSRPEPWGINE